MNRPQRPYTITWASEVADDIEVIAREYPGVLAALLSAVDDVTHHRKKGKALGERNISGDLTGCVRLKFDLEGTRPERFRIVYQLTGPFTITIWTVGRRQQHEVYQQALRRFDPNN